MFDIGWSELLVIGVVALIVVGPKDLPRMFAALGRFTAKARGMAREFQRAMDDAARESGVKEATDEMKAMVSKKNLGIDRIEDAARKFETWDPVKSAKREVKAAVTGAGSETQKLAESKASEAEARTTAAAVAQKHEATEPAPPAPGTPDKGGDA